VLYQNQRVTSSKRKIVLGTVLNLNLGIISLPMPKSHIKHSVKNMIMEYEGMNIDPRIGSKNEKFS